MIRQKVFEYDKLDRLTRVSGGSELTMEYEANGNIAYKSEAWGFEAQEIFRNMCVELRSPLEPMAMLDGLQAIERELGRTHKSVNGVYQSRTVDIDILLADDVRISNERLSVPHKLMYEREFALVPAREKWGEWVERNRPQ